VPIPESSSRVHGITNEMMLNCRVCGKREHDIIHGDQSHDILGEHGFRRIPRFWEIALNLAGGFSDCDFAGKNVRFDLEILANEFKRVNVEWGYAGARIVDGDRLEALLNPRDLSTLYEKYTGRKLEGAHGALADVKGAEEVICGQLMVPSIKAGECLMSGALPRDLDALHALQWPNYIDAEGKFKFDNGTPVVAFGKWSGVPMKDVEPSYWDWLLRENFNREVKSLAANAKMGKYPEVKT
jgi:DNA polymerase-3 subunit epsilon